jgi:excisionase family DNA binding protein
MLAQRGASSQEIARQDVAQQDMKRHELVTKPQVADYCQVSERTVDRWIELGLLDAVKLGPRLVRISSASVDRLLSGATDATQGA